MVSLELQSCQVLYLCTYQYQGVVCIVQLSVLSNIMERLNHLLCHLILWSIFHVALYSLSITISCVCVWVRVCAISESNKTPVFNPFSQFLVNKSLWIIQCQILQLMLHTVYFCCLSVLNILLAESRKFFFLLILKLFQAKASGKKLQRVALSVNLRGIKVVDLGTEDTHLEVSIYR